MSPTAQLPSPPPGRALRRWVIGGLIVAVLAGVGVTIALARTGGSPASRVTPAIVASWMQSHPGVADWMQHHPGEWAWMRKHWSEMQWMQEHWSGMAWLHDHPGVTGGSGMMGPMPMARSFPDMRRWMSGNAGTWAWMQAHWSSMSWWMASHWADMQWIHDHWNTSG
jgi:hypothetical protein